MSYYRHRVKRYYGDNRQTSEFGWTFTEQTAKEYQQYLNEQCKEVNERHHKFIIEDYIYLTHEIDESSYLTRDEYSTPLNQYIFRI